MLISKTVFKEYTRCPRVCALDNLYMKKMGTDVSFFLDDEKAEAYEALCEMFDPETGEDLIHPEDEQVKILLPYYNRLEDYAMATAEKLFGQGIIHNLDTKKQKCFSYQEGTNKYLCYLDGYQEDKDTIRVFEVKATSDNKLFKLGPSIKGVRHTLFDGVGPILRLVSFEDMKLPEKHKEKYNEHFEKLFDRFGDIGKYVFDLSIERNFIEHAIKGLKEYKDKSFEYYLVVLNHNYEYDGKIDEKGNWLYNQDIHGNELVRFIDLTEVTNMYQETIEILKRDLLEYIDNLNGERVDIGKWCERKKKTQCPFMRICWKEILGDGSIFEYIDNHRGFIGDNGDIVSTFDLANSGKIRLDSIEEVCLTRPINIIQRRCYVNHKSYFEKQRLAKEYYDNVRYPIYHLDFESFPCPLPRFKGEHPYQQSVFQFSLHVEKKMGDCDIEKNHLEFLAKDHADHREELIQKLIEYIDLSNGGTVLVYNENFEKNRMKEMGIMFPKYKDGLDNINNHVFDLMYLLKGKADLHKASGFLIEEDGVSQNYYDSRLHGSYSIKKVLPIFSDLTYKGMPIGNGNEAIVAYAKYDQLTEDELKVLQSDLVKYCRQDTWAMAVVLWGILEEVGVKDAKS